MNDHRLRLLGLKEQNDLAAEQMEGEGVRFRALARRHEDGTAPKAISAFNLFQTPQPLAAEMCREAQLHSSHRILEPSAGLGRLVDEMPAVADKVLIEQSAECCEVLRNRYSFTPELVCTDFLKVTVSYAGLFDRIVMNPPFKMGRDIKHIMHAYEFLKPGGRLVALCYNGVRQNKILGPWADKWHVLADNTFKSEGTAANVAMIIKNKPTRGNHD